MPDWRHGLVEAFPIPEDRRPGWRKRQKLAAHNQQQTHDELGLGEVEDAFSNLNLSVPSEPFRFFDLPSELRNKIYDYALFSQPPHRGPKGRRSGSRLNALLVNKKVHDEAVYVLYSTSRFKIFPIQTFDALPTVAELPVRYQDMVANLEMVVGPNWTAIPKNWKVTAVIKKCLKRLKLVKTLRLFVEFDPSHPAFRKYRFEGYIDHCRDLLRDVLDVMPQVQYVELDGYSSVNVNGPFVTKLKAEAEEQGKEIKYGKEAGWAHKHA